MSGSAVVKGVAMTGMGTAQVLEGRRRLAVARVQQGWTQKAVAELLGVNRVTVGDWMRSYRQRGELGLAAIPRPGRPRKLSTWQERQVLGWFRYPPTKFGFPTELWTGRRVTQLIEKRFGVRMNANYILDWLSRRGITSQKPARQPRERNERVIREWLRVDWLRIKKN